MESGVTKESAPTVAETQNVVNTDSIDTFQSFIYELFEKNGILNDLRAYLRGHIVNVLKSAQTGKKHLKKSFHFHFCLLPAYRHFSAKKRVI